MADLDELMRRFQAFGEECDTRAPLYGRLARTIAADARLAGMMLAAPAEQHNPTLLLCAVHDVLLAGAGDDSSAALAAFYPNLTASPSGGDPGPALTAFMLEHADELGEIVATHHTQTNEIGRCALFLPALGMIAGELDPDTSAAPLSLVDVGTSAGLNQLLPRYHYVFEPGGSVGPASTVTLTCGTRGQPPIPTTMPVVAATRGLDAMPIDVADDEAVRWLEACVWPDQEDRFQRLRAAIALARQHPPDVRLGDAVDDVGALVADAAQHGHPVVLNSWVLNYLSDERRLQYVEALDACGAQRDLSWVFAESPAQTPGLPVATRREPEHRTVLSLVRWRDGVRTAQRLATTHPHGYWLHWET